MWRIYEPDVPADVADTDAWTAWVRERCSTQEEPQRAVGEATAGSRTAAKLLLRMGADASVLELGCGTGLLAASLAPFASHVVAADGSAARLEAAARRLTAQRIENVTLHAIEPTDALPFESHRFDVVILSPGVGVTRDGRLVSDAFPSADLGPFSDVCRVLTHGGQLFWSAANRYSYEELSGPIRARSAKTAHSFLGYRSVLGRAGFRNAEFFELAGRNETLSAVRPLQNSEQWPRTTSGGIERRLKRSRWLVPRYGISATCGTPETKSLLEELLSSAEAQLEIAHPLVLQSFLVSRKEKAVLRVSDGRRAWMLRVPLSAPALESEARNAAMLETLAGHAVAPMVPAALARGDFRRGFFFLESTVDGTPLSRRLGRSETRSVGDVLENVTSLLFRLNPTGRSEPLSNELFEREVTRRIASLRILVSDDAVLDPIRGYFEHTLYGRSLPFGIVHGDFSVSNLLADDAGDVKSWIDWEDGSENGVLAIDAINFVESLYRHTSGRPVGDVIPQLARRDFASDDEARFMTRVYQHYRVDETLHEALVYFKWLRHMSYLQAFWLRYDASAIRRMVDPVIAALSTAS